MALNVVIEDVHDAATKTGNLVVGVVVRVDGASAVLDGRVRAVETVLAIWAQSRSCAVKIDGVLIQVGVWALNTLAGAGSVSVGRVEAAEPKGTDIGGEGPFTNPDVILELFGFADIVAILVAVGANISVLSAPGEVLVSIHDDVLVVIVSEEVIPD